VHKTFWLFRLLYQAVTFGGSPKFANLSRTDPAKISTGMGSSTHFHAVGGGAPIVFLSTIVVKDCNLQDAKVSSTGRFQKVIEGACIEGEWERLVGAIGHVIHAREFKAQYYMDNLSFATTYSSDNCMSDLFVYSDFLFECRWTMCLVPAVSSPSTFRSGNRRPSASNRFSRGPGGGGTSPVLACHDIGRWSFWISLFQHIIIALQFPSTMLENTPVTFMNCSQIWIVLSVSPRKFLRMLARSSPIRLTLGAGELRLTSLSTFSGRWFWVFQARNNCTLCSVILSTASSTCRIHIWLPSSVVAPFIPVCPYSFSRSVISSSFTLAVPQRFTSWVVCRYCRLSLHGCYIIINFGLWHEYVLNLLQGECADLNITTSLRIHVMIGSGTLHCCAKLCLFDIINFLIFASTYSYEYSRICDRTSTPLLSIYIYYSTRRWSFCVYGMPRKGLMHTDPAW